MKQANFFISHLKQQPTFKKLEQIDAYKKLFALLPNNLGDAVRFAYNKNGTLFIILEHRYQKFEFNYKITLIKSLLKKLIEFDISCKCIDADEIKIKVVPDSLRLKAHNKPIDNLSLYHEKSSGEFENMAKEERLKRIFEEIRGIICSKID